MNPGFEQFWSVCSPSDSPKKDRVDPLADVQQVQALDQARAVIQVDHNDSIHGTRPGVHGA